ncbi:glycosyltransferase [Veillonella parvula]|uniref:glycosyltransferase family 2 protein n=1 Tax=Veillonella parvula TaxID=29466 RepID=UPI001D05FEC5|nr:glycosyltransferase [Veillonella parvula]MCB6805048.1 glycosyltransferase [Veillonella parvula]MCQ4927510.1 glycosyltransferase [Veillonella parvula]MCQ4958699.1 glycosyltransferase [Veillonella parvula]
MQPLLSIIVPIYNVEQYLDRCIQSILNQTYQNLEIILVDDGATDCSGAIADSYAAKDKRIKVFHKENGGLSDARNYGLEHVTGDYILFIDSDDFIVNIMCERLITVASSNNADIVSCNYYIYRGDDDISIHTMSVQDDKRTFTGMDMLRYYLLKTEPFDLNVVWNKIFKLDLFNGVEPVRFPKGRVQEDNFTIFRLFLNANSIVTVNKPLYYYVQRAGSIMANFTRRFMIDTIESHMYMSDYLMNHCSSVKNELQLYLLNSYVELSRRVCANKCKKECNDLLIQYKHYVLDHTADTSHNPLWKCKQYIKRLLVKLYY